MSNYKSTKSGGSSKHQVRMGEGTEGSGETLYAFSYQSMADLFGVKVGTIRQWIHRKKFDPNSLESIMDLYEIYKYRHAGGDLEIRKVDHYVDIRVKGSDTKIFASKAVLLKALALFDTI